MLARVTYVDYAPRYPDDVGAFDPDDLVVRVVARAASGEQIVRYVTGCRPHIYVPAGVDLQTDTDEWTLTGRTADCETFDDKPCDRIDLAHPKQTDAIDDAVAWTYESDIPFYRRATWDYGLSGYVRFPTDNEKRRVAIENVETGIDHEDVDPIDPRVVIGDIEVLDESDRSFDAMSEAADAPIIAATWYDSYDDEYLVVVVDDEMEVHPPDVTDYLADHWDDHEAAGTYVEDSVITMSQVSDEEALLRKSVGFLQRKRPDIVSGWNFVDFDWYYLLERLEVQSDLSPYDLSPVNDVSRYDPDRTLSIQKAVSGLPAMDQMHAYCSKMTFGEWRSESLEYVASEELGVGKIDDVRVADAYSHQRSKLTAYNLLDVQLCVEMTERYAIESFFLTLADLCGIQIYDTFSEKREVDGYVGSRRDDTEVLPTQDEGEVATPAGGLVLSPSQGVENDVAVFDLKSLYPSSMLTANISPETMTDPSDADVVVPGMPEKEAHVDGRITEQHINWTDDDPSLPWSQRPKGFDLDDQGIMPKYVAKLFRERRMFKEARDQHDPDSVAYDVYDRRQQAIKVIMNSFYGVSNSRYYRLAEDGIGDAITGLSRYVLWRAAEKMEELGYEIIYGDTDSLMVSLDYKDERRTTDDLLMDAKGLASQLNAYMAEVADDIGLPDDHPLFDVADLPHDLADDANHLWYFEFEKLYGSFLQCGSKKRYGGMLDYKDGKRVDMLDVTGFEAERSDVTERTSEVQAAVIEMVLGGATFAEVSEYVRSEIDAVTADADNLHEIGVPWNLGKPLSGPDSYGNLPRARAARYSNEHLDKQYSVGDDYRGYYVRRTPSFVPETDVIALDWTDDIPADFELDVPKTVEKAFESALDPILDEMGWTFTEIREGKRNQPAADDAVMAYDGDPFASEPPAATTDASDDTTDDDDDNTPFEGAAAW